MGRILDDLLTGRKIHQTGGPIAMEVGALGESKGKGKRRKGKGKHTDNEYGEKGKSKRGLQDQTRKRNVP